jgi:hypothetical protein
MSNTDVEEEPVMTAAHLGNIFRLKSPSVVARVIDGEAILIAFETGTYFSARGSGAAVVEGVLAATPVSRIVGAFTPTDSFPRAEITRRVLLFLQQLRDEGLVAADLPHGDAPDEQAHASGGLSFEPPTLEKYRDLEDLLVLDPIHDVDAAGWPSTKARQ